MNTSELVDSMLVSHFRLAGSRAWAMSSDLVQISEDTDWDFVSQDNITAILFLEDKGFIKKNIPSQYCDTNSKYIYFHPEFPVECVIKKDLDLYYKVFHFISPQFYCNFLWKSSPTLKVKGQHEIREIINGLNSVAAGLGVLPI